MISIFPFTKKHFHWLFSALPSVVLLLTYAPSFLQAAQPDLSTPMTLTMAKGRILAETLGELQSIFSEPITFEEAPQENPIHLRSVTVLGIKGPTTFLVVPDKPFSVTLDRRDATSYLAANTVISAYQANGGHGLYKVVQQDGRIDVVPTHFLSSNGSMNVITPVMSRPLTFVSAKRTLPELFSLVAASLSKDSGYRVLPLNLPGNLLERVELGATGESAADVIAEIGRALNRPISFQCLFEPNEKAYCLNVKNVAPLDKGGDLRAPGKLASPKTGPSNSSFFSKPK